jgi:hypothetical protein
LRKLSAVELLRVLGGLKANRHTDTAHIKSVQAILKEKIALLPVVEYECSNDVIVR